MIVATIGFTKKSAERFFSLLAAAGVRTVVDVRLNNSSQLAGFAQGRDLPYFCRHLVEADYVHVPELGPTKELLESYRKEENWRAYEEEFAQILESDTARAALERVYSLTPPVCLLCSEDLPDQCHRRLVAERLQRDHAGIEISHLM